MPKLIDNIRGRAIEEARKVLIENGYTALTIRQIAKKLDIGIGTIYNYFPSKEYLAASVMLEDWQRLIVEFEENNSNRTPEETAAKLFDLVHTFTRCYVPTWQEYEQHGSSRDMMGQYHSTLVAQLTRYIRDALPAECQEKEPWLAEFIAEIVLRFGSDINMTYEFVAPAIRKLLDDTHS